MVKKRFLILLSLFGCLLLSGCATWKEINLNNYEFYTNFKYDNNSAYGKRCAYCDGRIYFFSNKNRAAGIYSMDADGKNLRFEGVRTKGIRKMQIKDNYIYYVGHVGRGDEWKNHTYEKYDLLYKEKNNINEKGSQKVKEKHIEEEDHRYYTWDFFCNDQNTIYIQAYCRTPPRSKVIIESYILENNEKLMFDQFKCLGERGDLADKNMFYLAEYNDIIYSMRFFPKEYLDASNYDPVFLNMSSDVYPFNKEQNHLVINYNPWLKNTEETNILQTNSNGYWLFTRQNKIKRVKENTNKMETVAELKGIKDIVFFLNLGKQAYIAAEKEDEADCCFVMDMDTYKVQEMFECGRDEYILAIDEGKLVTLKDSKICIRPIKAGSVSDSMKEIKFNERVNIRDYKFEVAANWMFVYHYNSERLYDLSYRVNMDTGEVK